MKLATDFNFPGGLLGVIKDHYADILAKRPKYYGNLPNKGTQDIDGEKNIRIEEAKGNIEIEKLTMLQKLVSNGLSTCVDLCCSLEQTTLRQVQVDLGFFD